MPLKSIENLVRALTAADLPELAEKATTGMYHDFISELTFPALRLAEDLRRIGTPGAMAVLARHRDGEFDAIDGEAQEWAMGPAGQKALQDLLASCKKPDL